jgi:hypothetical protein
MVGPLGLQGWQRPVVAYTTLPNRTMAEHCSRVRRLVKALNEDWKRGCDVNRQISNEERAGFDTWKAFLRPNLGGNILLRHDWLTTDRIVIKTCAADALHRMTLTTLALRRFELKNGHLPEHLHELVPAFLPQVPTDPFDNEPQRWNPEKQWLYSVGEDQTDNHGAHETAEKTGFANPDLVMPYWWLPAAEKK